MSLRQIIAAGALLVLAACSSNGSGDVTTDGTGGGAGSGAGGANQGAGVDQAGIDGPNGLQVQAIDRVFFATDQYDLDASAQDTLQKQAAWLKAHPNYRITVEGHADERGTREYNLALGDRRANTVANYLVALGVDKNRVSVVSYGKEQPAVDGHDESAWAQNRRGVTVVSQ